MRLLPGIGIPLATLAGFLASSLDAQELPDSATIPRWEVSAEMGISLLGLELSQGGNQQHPVRYLTNTPAGLGLGIHRDGLGGSFGFSYGKWKEDVDLATHSLDVQLFLHRPRLATDLYFQSYQGYFIGRDGTRDPIVVPTMKVSTQTANVYLKILGDLDLTSLSSPASLPTTTSWLQYACISVSRRATSSPLPLAPAYAASFYETLAKSDHLDVLIPSLSVGWLLGLRRDRFFFAPGIGFGFGYPIQLSGDRLDFRRQMKLNMRLMTGSDTPSGGWGLQVFGDFDELVLRTGENASFRSAKCRLFKSWML